MDEQDTALCPFCGHLTLIARPERDRVTTGRCIFCNALLRFSLTTWRVVVSLVREP